MTPGEIDNLSDLMALWSIVAVYSDELNSFGLLDLAAQKAALIEKAAALVFCEDLLSPLGEWIEIQRLAVERIRHYVGDIFKEGVLA